MHCPFCNDKNTKVLDTRLHEGSDIRRRRVCLKCSKKFTTVETLQVSFPDIIKKDKKTEPFQMDKLKSSIEKACYKRPISPSKINKIIDHIIKAMDNKKKKQLRSQWIGEQVLETLKDLDDVAYIRFASVHRKFNNIKEFVHVLSGDN